jgi:hypothetical protein
MSPAGAVATAALELLEALASMGPADWAPSVDNDAFASLTALPDRQ